MTTKTAYLRSAEEIKGDIRTILDEVQGPRTFACGESLINPPNPGLFLNDHGSIGMPLSEHDAKAITSKSKQSPFGRGSDTVLDTSIRKSWQLDPSQFSICNAQWNGMIRRLLDKVHDGLSLGCGTGNISAELYKLLLYEKGAFFKAHKDSEKTPGMFGTLVVCLSSPHEGGDLVVTHNDETMTFQTSSTSDFGMSFTAWYSDVLHEVRPVASGYRLVLTYNLIRRHGESITMPLSLSGYKHRLMTTLKDYNAFIRMKPKDYPNYLVHRLEHQYSQASLRADNLKGVDLGHMRCFRDAAAELGFTLYLANLEKTILKSDEYYSKEVYQRSVVPKYVANLDGLQVNNPMPSYRSSDLDMNKDQRLDSDDTDEEEADDEHHSGPTGNEGMTATYWYRNMVLVIVPPSRKTKFLYNCDNRNSKILSWVRELRNAMKTDPSQKPTLIDLCDIVLTACTSRPPFRRSRYSSLYPSPDEVAEEKAKGPLMQEIALAALDCDRVDFYDTVVDNAEEPLGPEVFERLGHMMAMTSELSPSRRRIRVALNLARNLSQKHKSLTSVKEGFLTALPKDDKEKLSRCQSWTNKVLVEAVNEATASQSMRKTNGSSLADIVVTWTAKDIQEHIVPAVLKCGTAYTGAFANRLMTYAVPSKHRDPKAAQSQILRELDLRELIKQVLSHLWVNCRLDSQALTTERTCTNRRPFSSATSTNEAEDAKKYEEALLTGSELSDVIQNTFLLDAIKEFPLHRILEQVIAATDKPTLTHTFLPFIKCILSQQNAHYQLPASPSHPAPQAATSLITRILLTLALSIGPEPFQSPTPWTQPRHGCGCSDCNRVDRFLASPTEHTAHFPMDNYRRHHLHSVFKDRYRTSYSIETLRGCNPNVWKITKNSSREQTRHAAWKEWFDGARREVRGLRKAGDLERCLGSEEMVDAVAELDAERIGRERERMGLGMEMGVERERSQRSASWALRDSDASRLSIAAGQWRGTKRRGADDAVAGDVHAFGNAGMKRRRDEPVVIDLT